MKQEMFLGADHHIFENAKQLRNNPTPSEAALWEYLKNKPLGYKFRRQHPINKFIADFYCHALKLIIEVDGEIHTLKDVNEYDNLRQSFLEHEGVSFIRFTNREVATSMDEVISKINQKILALQNK
jgi:very-short-patch-repair endonuclease